MINSVYIHIPFCNNICSYCDFCKMFYKKELVDKYLNALNKEVNDNYKGDLIKTLYIGGGTPSTLSLEQIDRLKDIINIFNLDSNCEFTFECNVDSLDIDKLIKLKEIGVNRVSIGVESFNDKHLKYLNRKHSKNDSIKIIKEAKKYFENINVDFIYALTNETMEELKEDIEQFLNLEIPHISTYSLIIEDNTLLSINKTENIDSQLDYEMYNYIRNTLEQNEYEHYEISNFSKEGYQSKHNLVYWNNLEYYGFGLGSSGYVNGVRYGNTRNIFKYLEGNYIKDEQKLSSRDKIEEEMFLGLRKINGVNISEFKKKYNKDIEEVFDIKDLLERGKLIKEKGYIKINKDYIYVSNDILINFIGEL